MRSNIFYNPNNFEGNILYKGKAEKFNFKIPTSSLYEPYLYKLLMKMIIIDMHYFWATYILINKNQENN